MNVRQAHGILLDLVLPGIDGLTLVRKLKANPETRAIPVVAVTAYLDRLKRKTRSPQAAKRI
jgi:CheY-like chemotaxis protein